MPNKIVHKIDYFGETRYVVFDTLDYCLFDKEEIDDAAIRFIDDLERFNIDYGK